MTTLPQTSPMRLPRPTPSHLAIPSVNGHGVPMMAPAPAPGITGADAWRIIRANLWLIIGVVIASAIGGFFLNVWLLKNYARYTSTALIEVRLPIELPKMDGSGQTLAIEPAPQSIEVEQQNQASMLTNKYFLNKILETADSPIRQTDWFKQWGTHIDDAKEDLEDKLEVTPRANTRLIAVAFPCPSARDSQTIVRAIVEEHIRERREKISNLQLQKSQDLSRLIGSYRLTLDSIHGGINDLATQLARYGESQEGTGPLEIELADLIHQQEEALKDRNDAIGKRDTFVKLVREGLTPKELQQYLTTNGNSGAIDSMIAQLQGELDVAKERYGENSEQYKGMQIRLKALQGSKEETEGATKERAAAAIKESLDSDALVAQQTLDEIDKRLKELRQTSQTLAAQRAQIVQQKDQEKTLREQLQKAQDESDKLALFIGQNNWSTADMYAEPDFPDKPSFPRLPITMSLAIGLGLALSVGIAFLREMMDTTVRSPRDIARVGQLNLLGLIPHESDDPQVAAARLPLAIYEAPHSIIAEQFRQVRTRLQHSASLDTVRSLLVTGTSPGDGKTTVACNLAAGLALNGRRILLVDANFRKPQIHVIFNLPNENGFGDVLNSPELFDDAVHDTEVPNLSVVTAGARPSNPTELLESQLLIDFVERALEEYDHVIFDSGPLLIVSETAALAPRVDGVVTVVRARGNSRGLLQRMRDQLRQLKAEHLGVILNAVRSQSGGYYAPMIKSYYAYQNS